MFENKKVLVCGMAKSGQAAVELLVKNGACVTAQDMKENVQLDFDPAALNVSMYLGKNPDDIVCDFDLVIISPGISVYAPFVKKAQATGIKVWGEAELAYQASKAPFIAITGTNGKTTVTTLVGEIMKRHNPHTVVAGNIGVPLTSLVASVPSDGVIVAEISSFQLETVDAFKPWISAVLNMTEDHIDRHGDMETYIAMKSRIFENQDKNDFTVLNIDNDITKNMRSPAVNIHFSTVHPVAHGVYIQNDDVCVHGINQQDTGAFMKAGHSRVMAENVAAVTAICACAGAPLDDIREVLETFKGVEHRLEFVRTVNGSDYYNDSKATNTDAAIKGLESFDAPVVLIGGGYDKHTDFTPWVTLFGQKVAQLIVFGETSQQIIETCDKIGYKSYIKVADLYEAVQTATQYAKPGIPVVFSPACASFDMFKNFEERGRLFKSYVMALT